MRAGRILSVSSPPVRPSLAAGDGWALIAIIAVGVAVIAATAGDYGVPWDEPVQITYGELVKSYFLSLGRDQRCNTHGNLALYGPGFELLAAFVAGPWPHAIHEIRHALTAACALMTAPALLWIARRAALPWAGVLGAAALLLLPAFYGHAFINSKDIPFACLYAWSIAAVMQCCLNPVGRPRQFVIAGAFCGAMLCVRPGGVLVIAPVVIGMYLWLWLTASSTRRTWHWPLVRGLILAGLIAWVVMVLPWPYAHGNIAARPVQAIAAAASFPWRFMMLFDGQVVMSDALPRRYLLQYLWITTPPSVLLFVIVGLLRAVREQWREPKSPQSLVFLTLQVWLLFPVIAFAVRPPNVYDGIRHFLFLLPALGLWYGVGLHWAASEARRFLSRQSVGLIAAGITMLPVPSLVRLHPYAMTYYNVFAGGVAGAAGRYETDYWLLSYREALEWINRQAALAPSRQFRVVVVGPLSILEGRQLANVTLLSPPEDSTPANESVTLPSDVDFAILTTRGLNHQRYPDSPIAQVVGRQRAAFTVIRAAKPLEQGQAGTGRQ